MGAIKGIGTDIVEIARLQKVIDRQGDKFAQRILTDEEFATYQQSKTAIKFLAKRFAAKEAAAKAIGTGIGRGIGWHDFNIGHDDLGKPELQVSGGAKERMDVLGANQADVSISDEQQYAIAFVVLS